MTHCNRDSLDFSSRGSKTVVADFQGGRLTTDGGALLLGESMPILITSGPMLCRLHVWTEEQWAMLPEAERPAQYTHAPGLGWIGAVPIACMN